MIDRWLRQTMLARTMTIQNSTTSLSRRSFLTGAAAGVGMLALESLQKTSSSRAASTETSPAIHRLRPKPPHFAPKATNCIFLFLAGGTSQIELFDPKPNLVELTGQHIPESFTKGKRFSNIKLNESFLMGSRFKYRRYGQCGMEMSELLPHIGSCADDIALIRTLHHHAFSHGPGELEFCTGKDLPGRPSAGAWLTYGLGTECDNLPGYVVLMNQRSPVTRALSWGSGFLPSDHAGVLFRGQGEPILNLKSPQGVPLEVHRRQLDAVGRLNRLRFKQTGDPKIASNIAAYELAFRMQAAAPELIDLSQETQVTLDAYGVDRDGSHGDFARNCLLSRRLVERGVRCVTVCQRQWDFHEALAKRLPDACRQVDQPIAALLKDLKRRGLLDTTLVIWGTEFGCTPLAQNDKPEAKAGRDHHPFAFSLWMAGGGVKGGQVIGKTDEIGWAPVEDPVHLNDFHATMLHLFGLDHHELTFRFKGFDFRLTDVAGEVVTKLVS